MRRKMNWIIPLAVAAIAGVLLFVSTLTRPASSENVVVITVQGEEYARIPLSQPQRVEIRQDSGEVNVVVVTENGAYMESSTCKNQQCVHMGEVTLENWETRTNQEYIICLPNQVVVQLVAADQGQS